MNRQYLLTIKQITLLTILMLLGVECSSSQSNKTTSKHTSFLIQPGGNTVVPELQNLLKFYSLQYGQGTPEEVNKALQKNFLRKKEQERKDLEDDQKDKAKREKALKLFAAAGNVTAIPITEVNMKAFVAHATLQKCKAMCCKKTTQPVLQALPTDKQLTPDYSLVFGAAMPRVVSRQGRMIKRYEENVVQPKHIVLLGSVRKLWDKEQKSIQDVLQQQDKSIDDLAKKAGKENADELTETDLMRFVWEQHATDGMKDLFTEAHGNLCIVNATDTYGPNERPMTADTVRTWLEDHLNIEALLAGTKEPQAKIHLHFSMEQPYAIRFLHILITKIASYCKSQQDLEKFRITFEAPGAVEDIKVAILKDAIARRFYTERSLKEALKKLPAAPVVSSEEEVKEDQ